MNASGSERAVSTVVDVALALLLVTAAVMLVGYTLADATEDPASTDFGEDAVVVGHPDWNGDDPSASRTTTVLEESTITVTYSLDALREEEAFSEPTIAGERTDTRTDHGSPLDLLADAAVTNHRIDGEPVLAYGEEYEDAVDWSIRHALLGAERDVYVVAEWEPYDGAALNGTATAGERPPADADVSSSTTTVPSGFSAVDGAELEERWLEADDWWDEWIDDVAEDLPDVEDSSDVPGLEGSDGKSYAAAGTVVGEEIVEGLFPPGATQYALEDQGIDRELTVYQYRSMVDAIGDFSFRSPDTHPPLVRSDPSADAANHRVLVGQDGGYDVTDADALAAWIAADVPVAFSDEFDEIDDRYDGDERDEEKVETVLEGLSIDEVTITVHTWNE